MIIIYIISKNAAKCNSFIYKNYNSVKQITAKMHPVPNITPSFHVDFSTDAVYN